MSWKRSAKLYHESGNVFWRPSTLYQLQQSTRLGWLSNQCDFFFLRLNSIVTFDVSFVSSSNPHAELARVLLSKATEQKKSGDLGAAICTLRVAYEEIAKSSVDHTVATFLRLPLYLHASGRKAEAWQAFRSLIENGYPNMPQFVWSRHSINSRIYEKMRLVFQREKNAVHAICMEAHSIVQLIRSELARPKDKHWDEARLSGLLSESFIRERLGSVFKGVSLKDSQPRGFEIVLRWARALPSCDDQAFESELVHALGVLDAIQH
jgi:hypothetical protein